MENATGLDLNLYKDIQGRTNGEIYIGVVGPVRTGKSTFIKRFMDICVLPFMEDPHLKERTIDELPQSAQGKTIMTTEPKFIPQEAAEVELEDGSTIKVRLIDCVGFLVEGASGHMEGDENRMVKTPWSDMEIPFSEAAAIGTRKVIHDHSTIGIVVTTDGSIGEIPRENYLEAEQEAIKEIQGIGKPFVIVLNCERPFSEETENLRLSMEESYQAPVVPVNCKQMKKEDISRILEKMLLEFPLAKMEFFIPKWMEMLPTDHRMKKSVIMHAGELLNRTDKMRDVYGDAWKKLCESTENHDNGEQENYISGLKLERLTLSEGCVSICIEVDEKYYFENISEMTGVSIQGEYQLISMVRELSEMKKEYEKVKDAMEAVRVKGYGVVMPMLSDITMEDPVLIRHGNKFGVKIKAVSPSIHMIKANIETEVAPIVGNEEQAKDLIEYIKAGEESNEGIWTTNIFGKSLGELMEDGIRSKVSQMDDECQLKLQDTMQKIVNDNNGGMICIII